VASPYSPPSADLTREPRQRIAQAIVAFFSALLLAPSAIFVVAYLSGYPLSKIAYSFPAILRPIGFVTVGAIVASLVMLPLQRLKWYWALIFGPVIALVVIVPVVFIFGYLERSLS
jgi:hypothetical protein